MEKYQEVQVMVSVGGDYCAWHELSLSVCYDITNNKSVGWNEESLEEMQKLEEDNDGDYIDYQTMPAIKIGNDYYINI